jgi:hypothetical protein
LSSLPFSFHVVFVVTSENNRFRGNIRNLHLVWYDIKLMLNKRRAAYLSGLTPRNLVQHLPYEATVVSDFGNIKKSTVPCRTR